MNFKSVLIAGAGTMGRGIAELFVMAGFEVELWDINPGSLGRASASIERSLRKQVQIGRLTDYQLDDALNRIRLISDLRVASPRTDLILEAIVEDVHEKQTLLKDLEARRPEAWLATNTGSISISKLASVLKQPSRLVGMHFFNPAPAMPLVEIIYAMKTDENWIHGARQLAERRLGKQTIIVKDCPGFASSRLGTVLALEAMRMLEANVASAEDIDKSMEYGYRHPMGPLRLSDWMGLDVRLQTAKILYAELGEEAYRPPQILERMVAEGKLGRKSGEGFYKWPKDW